MGSCLPQQFNRDSVRRKMKKRENTRQRRGKQFFLPTQGPLKTVIHLFMLFSLVIFHNSKFVLKSFLMKKCERKLDSYGSEEDPAAVAHTRSIELLRFVDRAS